MTLCQQTFPLDTANLVAAARVADRAGLGSKANSSASPSIQPRKPPPNSPRTARCSPPPRFDWIAATGSPAALNGVWATLGVSIDKVPDRAPFPRNWATHKPLTYDLTHSDELFAIDPDGHERFILDGAPANSSSAPIPPALASFLDDHGRQNLPIPTRWPGPLPQELQVLSWLTGTNP